LNRIGICHFLGTKFIGEDKTTTVVNKESRKVIPNITNNFFIAFLYIFNQPKSREKKDFFKGLDIETEPSPSEKGPALYVYNITSNAAKEFNNESLKSHRSSFKVS
jgi:hypothetical protein